MTGFLRCYQPRGDAAVRLVCLPHAGGSASFYRPWSTLLDEHIELHAVQYAGREDRLRDPFVRDMDRLVGQLVVELSSWTGRPYALFGHSMGGAVAYEVALRLRGLGAPPPVRLFISGRQPPIHHHGGGVHLLDDSGLAAELARLSPANATLLAEPELLALVLPAIRNDYHLIETYRPTDASPLSCPVIVLVGDGDRELTARQAQDWATCTDAPPRVHTFPGDHFYLLGARRAVVDLIADELRPAWFPSAKEAGSA